MSGRFQPRSTTLQTLPGTIRLAEVWPGASAEDSPYNPLTEADNALLVSQQESFNELQKFLAGLQISTNGKPDQAKTDTLVTSLLAIQIKMTAATIAAAGATPAFWGNWIDWAATLVAVKAAVAGVL